MSFLSAFSVENSSIIYFQSLPFLKIFAKESGISSKVLDLPLLYAILLPASMLGTSSMATLLSFLVLPMNPWYMSACEHTLKNAFPLTMRAVTDTDDDGERRKSEYEAQLFLMKKCHFNMFDPVQVFLVVVYVLLGLGLVYLTMLHLYNQCEHDEETRHYFLNGGERPPPRIENEENNDADADAEPSVRVLFLTKLRRLRRSHSFRRKRRN